MTDPSLNSSLPRFLGDGTADDEDHFGVHISFEVLYSSIIFLAAIYAAGTFVSRFLFMPALVGEIFTGILLGPNMASIVPESELKAFVLLGEIGLILLVLEAGIDIDLTTLKLIGGRGFILAIIGTFLPIAFACGVSHILGFTGLAAIAAGCTFAPTSLGIAMNILRQSGFVNTPVGQLIVAVAIIDDMVALVLLSQLQALASGTIALVDMLIPIASAMGFLVIGGYLAIFVLPGFLNWLILDRIEKGARVSREWTAMAILFCFLLLLIPATYYAKASPLMGAFLAGLIFCSNADLHHMFVSQFKRVMQWLMRIFFAASIGFQVPVQEFADRTVVLQGLAFTAALLGKVIVGFMIPNFTMGKRFRGLHLRDCLIVGCSMAAEGEFAFVIAVYSVTHQLISQALYASVVLAVLLSTIVAPFLLRMTISHFNEKILGTGDDTGTCLTASFSALEKKLRDGTAIFFCVQTSSAPAWGIQSTIMQQLIALKLDTIDHRSWHPRHSSNNMLIINEVYVRDADESFIDGAETEKGIKDRADQIAAAIAGAIDQANSTVKVQRWIPQIPDDGPSTDGLNMSISERIVHATSTALESSRKRSQRGEIEGEAYFQMDEDIKEQPRRQSQISHLSDSSKGRLDGLFRHDGREHYVRPVSSEEEVELLDYHGFGTGFNETRDEYDYHGQSLA